MRCGVVVLVVLIGKWLKDSGSVCKVHRVLYKLRIILFIFVTSGIKELMTLIHRPQKTILSFIGTQEPQRLLL